ncbi:MAG: putative lipid II flippase FtsW [Oscillospiraceae bacterium]|nr:putative lipid II flippase FtsW [Oscillospiraceae bacterium]
MQQARQNIAGRQSAPPGGNPQRPVRGSANRRPVRGNVSADPRRAAAGERIIGASGAAVRGTVNRPVQNNSAAKRGKPAKKAKDPNRVRFWSFEGKADVPMLAIILILLGFGITAMFSAGHALAYKENEDSFYYIKHQLPAAGLGLVGMFALMLFDYRFLRYEFKTKNGRTFTLSHIILAAMLFLNALCLPFGVSNKLDGQKRWLRIPVFGTFQPSDLLKIAVIIFIAYYIQKHKDVIRKFRYGLLRPGILFLALVVVLFGIQTHLSALLIVFMTCAVMLFVGGINMKPAVLAAVIAVLVIVVAIQFSDFSYFTERINYMDPLSEPWDRSYQNYQSALAIGSGGIWGKGFGNSSQKYYYLPEAQNDFVYAIWVEEFGLIGGFIIILLFMVFIFRGFCIARNSEDRFGSLLATGITFQIGIQALLNIGVNLCCIPNTGISLPFFSYGGTALMIQLWEMGLLLSVSKRAKLR